MSREGVLPHSMVSLCDPSSSVVIRERSLILTILLNPEDLVFGDLFVVRVVWSSFLSLRRGYVKGTVGGPRVSGPTDVVYIVIDRVGSDVLDSTRWTFRGWN